MPPGHLAGGVNSPSVGVFITIENGHLTILVEEAAVKNVWYVPGTDHLVDVVEVISLGGAAIPEVTHIDDRGREVPSLQRFGPRPEFFGAPVTCLPAAPARPGPAVQPL